MREFIRRQTLAISMMAGAGSYFILSWLPLAGGFYSIWHNVYNSWQLAQMGKRESYLFTTLRPFWM